MSNASFPDEIDLEQLSRRERDVVERAIEGYTDEQIAQSMEISVSTVNSYWVRIRSKLGRLTRTEIVAASLRREMAIQIASLEAEIEQLQVRHAAERQTYLSRESGTAQVNDEPWRFLAVGYLCEPVLMVQKSGEIIYANPIARDFLRASRHELEGMPFWHVTTSEGGESCEKHLHDFFANQEIRRGVVGIRRPYYARRRDDTVIRITIAAQWFESPDGVVASVSLREYTSDSERHFLTLPPPFAIG